MKRVELPTGAKGFTLVETLFAAVILSIGVIFITPALFKSSDAIQNVAGRYEAEILANNLMVETEESLRRTQSLDSRLSAGEHRARGIVYRYEIESSKQDRLGRLYLLTTRIEWKDFKSNRLVRDCYISQ